MGCHKKGNNMPIRIQRKQNVRKDANNFQRRGKSGAGRIRAQGREKQVKERQKKLTEAYQAQLTGQAAEVKPISYIELSKQNEDKVLATPVAAVVQQQKSKKRKRKGGAAADDRPEHMEKSFHPQAGMRTDTVEFDEDADDGDKGEGPPTIPVVSGEGVQLVPGASVRIAGLQGAPELNGKLGTCLSWDADKGRWLVSVEGGEKSIRPDNLGLLVIQLKAGSPVRILGLRGAHELNGKVAVCRSWDSTKHRWLVAFDEDGEKLLKPENLEIWLQPGSFVRLVGLTAAPQLNGREAVCIRWEFVRERWLVRLEGGDEKMLRPVNLDIHGAQEKPLVNLAVKQTVSACQEQEKPEQLRRLMRRIHEDEKRGKLERALTIVFCNEESTVPVVADLLSKHQFGCVPLVSESKYERARGLFNMDKKHILVTTDECAKKLRKLEDVHRVVNYDFPNSVATLCQRLASLGTGGEQQLLEAHSFFTGQDLPVANDFLSLLESTKTFVDPKLLALIASTGEAVIKRAGRKVKNAKAQKAKARRAKSTPQEATADQDQEDSQKDTG
ncbi:unnamed protein product [Polarella glacialis]|uniref:RNA helicase n=1 Tax=Polarella glacialis TaxID=89957 RepID=A0A813H792_POLGL|nr:unnamed protein product [Polarella glacialis]CAE8661541.1 unnamed protein product [Polarella glacialis]